MRLVAGLLALTLTGSLAFAEEAKAPEPQPEPARGKVPLRVVKVMPDSHQALLFDKDRGTHVLADLGSSIEGYTVQSIDEDEVTLASEGREVVLAAPDQSWRRRRDASEPRTKRTASADATMPEDPYAPAVTATAPAAEAPVDPYDDAPVRVVEAPTPMKAGEGGVRVASAPSAPRAPSADDAIAGTFADVLTGTASAATTSPASRAPAPTRAPAPIDDNPYAPGIRELADAVTGTATTEDPYADAQAPVVAPTTSAAKADTTVLARRDVSAALANFDVLTRSVRGAFTSSGARLDMVAPGSVFAKAGLRDGDVVTAVDGKPLRSIDDAADLYVSASGVRTTTVQVLRAGTPITLRISIR